MNLKFKYSLVILSIFFLFCVDTKSHHNINEKPNIIIFLADDLGWDDVSFHGHDTIRTPNIDALAYNGVIMNRFYAPPLCSPSRTALLTGKYPIHTGTQQLVILNNEPWGLGLEEKLLPQYLKEVGYNTHLIGKWHVGFFEKAYNPKRRGFDSFFGYYGGFIDYFNYTSASLNKPLWKSGYDMRDEENTYYDHDNTYATDLFTQRAVKVIKKHDTSKPMFMMFNHLAPHAGNEIPLQAPEEEIAKFSYIDDPKTKILAAMISRMDSSIGTVMETLHHKGMLDNSIVIFYSDNGAPNQGVYSNYGSNLPLKGQKQSPWEGALRVPAVIWSPYLKNRECVTNQLYHVTDILPTLLNAAGVRLINTTGLDGFDIWKSLSLNEKSPRTNILHNIDDYESYMSNNWKYVNGTTFNGIYDKQMLRDEPTETTCTCNNNYNNYYHYEVQSTPIARILSRYRTNQQIISNKKINKIRSKAKINCNNKASLSIPCNTNRPCLYNIIEDPCEFVNLADSETNELKRIVKEFEKIKKTMVPPRNKQYDPNSNPELHCLRWTWWKDEPNYAC